MTCLLRRVPFFFRARPRTPLRVLGIVALDALHVIRTSQPLPRRRAQELALFLDFQGCANAAWDHKALSRADYHAIQDELADRFGAPPAPARHLLELRRIRLLGGATRASEMKLDHGKFEVWLRQPLTPKQAHTILTRTKEDLEFLSGKEMGVRLKRAQGDPEAFLGRATKLLQALGETVSFAAK